ncbi:MAG: thioester domain-containing protein [Oscillospiraceae bacterium]|nr:thioester domain-containing protein [Oscillospiraceae bacterium]
MKTSIFKRGMALLLAVLLCFTTLIGSTVVPAFASGIQEEVRMTAFPQTGDAQFSADWGHNELHYMNDWGDRATRYLYVRAVGDYEGQICYCIEPGVNLTSTDVLTQRNEGFWDNYPSEYNHTISPDDIKLLIGRILQYGYRNFVSRRWMSQNAEDADRLGNATATQLLIWETIVGERDADFNKVSTDGKDPVLSGIRADNPIYDQVILWWR